MLAGAVVEEPSRPCTQLRCAQMGPLFGFALYMRVLVFSAGWREAA